MDMEMVQYHPTTLAGSGFLMTEAARGEGAYLLNGKGERFLKDYAPNKMELAARDVISRAEATEIAKGNGIDGNVSARPAPFGRRRHPQEAAADPRDGAGLSRHRHDQGARPRPSGYALPNGRREDERRGSDAASRPVRRRRGRVRQRSRRQPAGRELAARYDRLRSPFGKSRGRVHQARLAAARPRRRVAMPSRNGSTSSSRDRTRARRTRGCGSSSRRRWTRTSASIATRPACSRRSVRSQISRSATSASPSGDKGRIFNQALQFALELGFMFDCAETIIVGALLRKESRGAQARTDYPSATTQSGSSTSFWPIVRARSQMFRIGP